MNEESPVDFNRGERQFTVEVLLLKQVPPGPTLFEVMYFGLGLLVLGLAVFLWRAEVMRKSTHPQPTSL
jgi:hypothetical protein